MRNLKRALSLALASVMLLGMMVVGTSAASYPDVDSNDNVEAIEVLQAVGAMKGDENGKFNPDDTVTRNEMATVIARLMLGAEAENYLGTHPFTDVPGWADKYVAACYNVGVVKGTSATTYNGTATVTAQEAATMMLRVLGYEQIAGTGADWARPVVAMANQIGLFRNVTGSAIAPMTRNQVAQLSLNALEADMVKYEMTPAFDGTAWVAQGKYEPRKDLNNVNQSGYNYTKDTTTTHQKEYLQLCEDLYDGKLIKNTSDHDDFDRPATTWSYKGKVIGSYMNTSELTYTDAVKLSDIYKDLSLNKGLAAEDVIITRNGADEPAQALNKTNTNKIGGKGVLTQVWYHSGDEPYAEITMIDTFVGKVSAVTKATSTSGRTITLTGKGVKSDGTLNVPGTLSKFETENFAVDDVVLYTASHSSGSKYDVQTVEALGTPITGTLTKWVGSSVVDSEKGKSDSSFAVDGTTYKYSANKSIVQEDGTEQPNGIAGFSVNKDEVNVYLDKYDYAIYVSGVEGEVNYAAVIGVGSENLYGDGSNGATLLLADGTQKTVKYKMKGTDDLTGDNQVHNESDGSNEGWSADIVQYRVLSDGTYELSTPAVPNSNHVNTYDDSANEIVFKNGKSEFILDDGAGGSPYNDSDDHVLYTTEKTVFFVATKDGNAGKIAYNVYTGYKSAPGIKATETNHSVAYVLNSYYTKQIDAVYLAYDVMDGVSAVDTWFVKAKGADITTTSEGRYYILPAVVDGEITTVKVDASLEIGNGGADLSDNANTYGVYAVNNVITDKNGIITSADRVALTVNNVTGTVDSGDARKVLGVGGDKDTATFWAYNDKTLVYRVADDYKSIDATVIGSINTDDTDKVYASVDNDTKVLETVFVVDVEDGGDDDNDGDVKTNVVAIKGTNATDIKFLTSGIAAADLTKAQKEAAVRKYLSLDDDATVTFIGANIIVKIGDVSVTYTEETGAQVGGGVPDKDKQKDLIANSDNLDAAGKVLFNSLANSSAVSQNTTITPTGATAANITGVEWKNVSDIATVPAFGSIAGYTRTSGGTVPTKFAIIPILEDDGESLTYKIVLSDGTNLWTANGSDVSDNKITIDSVNYTINGPTA